MTVIGVLHRVFFYLGAITFCCVVVLAAGFVCFLVSEWWEDRRPRHPHPRLRVLQGGRRR